MPFGSGGVPAAGGQPVQLISKQRHTQIRIMYVHLWLISLFNSVDYSAMNHKRIDMIWIWLCLWLNS